MDKPLNNNAHNSQPPTTKGADSSIGEKVTGVANVVHGAGEILRGRFMELADCGKGPGSEIAAEGRAEFERGSNKLGHSHKSATAPTTSTGDIRAHTGAAYDSKRADPYAATGVSTTDPSDTRRDADPGCTEKEAVPNTVDDGGYARPEYRDEKRPMPQTTSPGPPRSGGAQYDTEGQKTNVTFPMPQEKTSDTANYPDPTFKDGQREHSDTANVPE